VEADAQAARDGEIAVVIMILTGEDLEQGGLARAVGADEADTVVVLHGERDAL